jgi:phosphate starvation-inducible PhoH-like protein
MAKQNIEKAPPKGNIRFSISLSEEQKSAKEQILQHPFNFIIGKAGSGKTLLAVQVALDMYFKRMTNKIVITRPTVSNEDNGFFLE